MGSPSDIALQLAQHPHVLAFLGLLATGLGLPIPEDVILLAAGAVVAWQDASLYPMVGVCLSGILLGDTIMFLLGTRFGLPLLRARPLCYLASQRSLDRALASFRAYGAGAVFLGRFLAGVRVLIFFTAGASGVHWSTFVLMDCTAALLSVPFLVLLGYAFGSQLQGASSLLEASGWYIAAALAVLLLATWGTVRLVRAAGIGERTSRAVANLGRATTAYLGKRRILRLSLLLALAATLVLYTGLSLRTLPDADRNHGAVASIRRLPLGGSYAFAVIGSGRTPSMQIARLLRAIDEDEQVRFTVSLGGLVFDGEPEKYRHLLRQLDDARKPLVTALGSSELAEGGRLNFYRIFGPYYFSFRVGSDSFVILDNAETGRFSESQKDWALRAETGTGHTRFRFAFFHQPLQPLQTRGPTGRNWRRALVPRSLRQPDGEASKDSPVSSMALLKGLDVTRAFATTGSGQAQGQWEDIPYSLTGGVGARPLSFDPSQRTQHYLRVHVGPEGVTSMVVPVAPPLAGMLRALTGFLLLHIHSFFATHGVEVAVFVLLAALAWDFYIHRVRDPRAFE